MSIFAYTGFPGSGKSYSVVEQQVLPALRAGRTVVTNLPMKADLVKAEIGGDLRPFDYARALADPNTILEDVPSGCVWVLDEVYKLFPAGVAVAKVPDPFKQILAEHRHRVDAAGNSMQIVFVCQDLAQISAFARQLVESTFRTTKLTALGLHKRFRVDVFNGPVSGANPPINSRLREIPGKYDPKVYRYYTSHTLSESGKEGANELAIDKRANALKRPLLMMAPVVMLVLGYFGLHHLWVRGAALGKTVPQVGNAPGGLSTLSAQAQASAGRAAGSSAPAGGSSNTWTVKGVVFNSDHPASSVAYVLGSSGAKLIRPFDKCALSQGSLLRCEIEGNWYSETGAVVGAPDGVMVWVPSMPDYQGPAVNLPESVEQQADELFVPYGEGKGGARAAPGASPSSERVVVHSGSHG